MTALNLFTGYNNPVNMVLIEEQIYTELALSNTKLAHENSRLEIENRLLRERLLLVGKRLFMPSSEKLTLDQIKMLFDEIEATAAPQEPEPELETIAYTRRRGGQRTLDLSSLPVEEKHYTLSEAEQVCPKCEGQLHKMGEEVRQELKHTPAKLVLFKHICAKYACRHCQNHEIKTPILTAPMPAPAFPGSLASPSLVANILCLKYVLGVPLYRQEQDLQRRGVALSRQNLSNWALRGADLLLPLYRRLYALLLKRAILHADETEVQVLKEAGRSAENKSYMWLYRSGREGPPIALYEYQPTRAALHPQKFLSGFTGYLHVDGYAAYESVLNVKLVGCWAHARRKFTDALSIVAKSVRDQGGTEAHTGLKFCQSLFKIERDLQDGTAEARFSGRLERSSVLLDKMHVWLLRAKEELLPKSSTGMAVSYCLNQWSKLVRFLEDGRLELDNNRSERSIKPFVIGRKNWLFSITPKGATSSAMVYSLVETAKENGLDPLVYLTYLFERLPNIDTRDLFELDKLLPWDVTVQSKFRPPTKTNR